MNKRWRTFYPPEYGAQRRLVGWLILGAEVCVRILGFWKGEGNKEQRNTLQKLSGKKK